MDKIIKHLKNFIFGAVVATVFFLIIIGGFLFIIEESFDKEIIAIMYIFGICGGLSCATHHNGG